MPKRQDPPYYIADALEPFTFRASREGGNSTFEVKVRQGDVVYVRRALKRKGQDQIWEVSTYVGGSKSGGVLDEKELLNKIKVRRTEDEKPVSGGSVRDLHAQHVKPESDDLSEDKKRRGIVSHRNKIKDWSAAELRKSKVPMPPLEDLLQKYYQKQHPPTANELDYFSDLYNRYSDNPWSYGNGKMPMFPEYLSSPAEYFIQWLREEIKEQEISQHKNKAQLEYEEKVKGWMAKGYIPCDRCGGKGSSSAWKYTGSICYGCDGVGYIDPFSLEGSQRERRGLPYDIEELKEYMEEQKKKLNATNNSGRLWCSAFNNNYIGKIF